MKFLNLIHLSVKASKFFPLLLLGSILSPLIGNLPVQARQASSLASSLTICGIVPPQGYVVTRTFYSSNCGASSFNNALVIRTPVSGMSICAIVPPRGYVVTRTFYSSNCGASSFNNALVINKI